MGRTFDSDDAIAHLCAQDVVMARVIAAIGPYTMRADDENPFR